MGKGRFAVPESLMRAMPPAERAETPEEGEHVLGRIGTLQVRLARDPAEIATVQQLRFRVFCEELGACQASAAEMDRRDADRFDDICDHLLVVDTALPGSDLDRIVGTYRLLRDEMAVAAGG
jgi:L-ornithine Nalpha-acyltransferase